MKLTEDDIEVGKKLAFKIHAGSSQLKQQILDDQEKARKWDELQSRNAHIDFGEWLQDTKLRESIEEKIEDFASRKLPHVVIHELQKLLEGSKK